MSSAGPSFLALSCVGFIATAPAYAADPEPQRYGQPEGTDVVVEAQRERTPASAKQVAPLLDTPRSIVVVPKEVIEQTGSASLAEALRTVPGITFGAAEGGNPIGDRPFIRGFDSQGSTYVDGVRDFAAQSREVFAVESIQVVRGSDSTLGGRGGAGGTINILSKLPTARDVVRATGSYGSDDYKRATLDVNRRLGDTAAFRIQALYHDQDVAGRDAIYQRRWGVAPSLTVGLGTPTRLTAQYYYLESHELPDSGIPYLYTIGNAPLGTTIDPPAIGRLTTISGATGYVDRSTFYGLKDRDFRITKTHQATLRAGHDFGRVTLRNTSRFTHNVQNYIYTQPDDQQGNVFGTAATNPVTGAAAARGDVLTGGLVWRRANTRYGYADALTNQTDLFGTFDTGGIRHSFAGGIELDWEKARRGTYVTRGFLNPAGSELLSSGSTVPPRCNTATIARYYCTSLFTPNANDPYVNYASDTSTVPADVVRNLPVAETQNDARTQAVYAFDSITLAEPLILNVGARLDRFHSRVRPGQPVAATTQVAFDRTDTLFNWQAGVVLKPTRNTSVYASYATSATPPNSLLGEGQETNALPVTGAAAAVNPVDALKPEKTRTYEVGAKADLFGGRLNLTAAVFQTDIRNSRVTGENNTVEFGGERRIRGVEIGVNGQILPGWTAFGGYTHLDPRTVDGGFTALAVPAVMNGTVVMRPATTVQVVSVNTGRQATQTARDSLTAWTNVSLFGKLQVGGGAFYTSRVYGGYTDNRSATQDAAGIVTVAPATKTILRSIPGYWRFDARAAIELTHRIELSVNVQNLTDKTYFSQAYTAHYATIAPGRSAFATLAVRY
ncbi:TonB-dependent receptor [Sphingomonas sp.]|uniref:TonB-dependent receptor n=1 Tax=Sphingomonas sp. TaxID=28214 RepID=UPI0035BC7BA8